MSKSIAIADAFEVTIYLDLPDEAAAREAVIGWSDKGGIFRNEQDAEHAAREAAERRGWVTWSATIDRGHVIEERREGVPIRSFVDEQRDRWYAGPTWFDYESRA